MIGPPPPPFQAHSWHLPARCSEGDVNALFQFNGQWHLLQQWHLRPKTGVGHAVSNDLLHWTRVADALSSGDEVNQQCFDGSASLVNVSGVLTPYLMIDGGCRHKGPGEMPCMESSGNGSTGGVVAVPANLSDPDLVSWTVRGPTLFSGCDGSSGPGPIWTDASGRRSLVAIYNEGEARFEALDASLTRWKMADPSFISSRGGGGGLWHSLPPNVEGVVGGRWPTHICAHARSLTLGISISISISIVA